MSYHIVSYRIILYYITLYIKLYYIILYYIILYYIPGSSVGIATDYGLDGPGSNPVGTRFSTRPDRPWGPPNLLYNGYWIFPGSRVQLSRAADHSPPSSAALWATPGL